MRHILLLLAGSVLLANQVYAHYSSNEFNIGKMAADASLVFRGKVIAIDYRESLAEKNQPALPHTFVTFSVDDVLYGEPNATMNPEEITLRFLGGRSKEGGFMLVDQFPKFDIGDEDLLFVQQNGVAECPLVECTNGRFRMVDGMMYNEYGQSMQVDKSQRIGLGKTDLMRDEFNTYSIGNNQILTRKMHRSLSRDTGAEPSPTDPPRSDRIHVSAEALVAIVRDLVQKASPKDPLGQSKRTASVDKTQPFSIVVAPRHAKPSAVDVTPSVAKPQNRQEQLELDAILRSGGNPVLESLSR